MSVFTISGIALYGAYHYDGESASQVYDIDGNPLLDSSIPVPSGDLSAIQTIALPDLYETGKGFTCTGLAYDSSNDTFLVGDIGALTPNDSYHSQIVRLEPDFTTVVENIPIYETFSNMGPIQGITIDSSDGTIWFCCPDENKIRHISVAGINIGSITVSRPTGIAYSASRNAFWVLTYNNDILLIDKNGNTIESYSFAYNEALDQCFLDEGRNYLYITAGTNYTGRNNIYCFDTSTHEQSIACTVDSYSVEGIWLGWDTKMIILNDGYYHSALVAVNQVNIYEIDD